MTNKKWKLHIFGVASLAVFIVLGLASGTSPPAAQQPPPLVADEHDGEAPSRVGWTHHTLIPNKDYVVVGATVVRNANPWAIHADLMDRAIAMGGHDIINVRMSWHSDGTMTFVTATAAVIRYTDTTVDPDILTYIRQTTITSAPAGDPAVVAPQQQRLLPGPFGR
jgi:hypothetical protein